MLKFKKQTTGPSAVDFQKLITELMNSDVYKTTVNTTSISWEPVDVLTTTSSNTTIPGMWLYNEVPPKKKLTKADCMQKTIM